MRITFLVNHDLASLLALNHLIPSLDGHDTTVFFSQKTASTENKELAALAEYDSTQVNASSLISFEEFGGELLNKINTTDYQKFASTKPDLAISIRHMSIFKSMAINTPQLGIINLHSGKLPAYQGVMATFWALRNKEQYIGTTLHRIEDSSIDTGAIISQSTERANYGQSYLWNVLNIYKAGCQNILSSIRRLEEERSLESKSQTGLANYYSFPTTQDITRCDLPLFNRNDNAEHFI